MLVEGAQGNYPEQVGTRVYAGMILTVLILIPAQYVMFTGIIHCKHITL